MDTQASAKAGWELVPSGSGFDLLREGRRIVGIGGTKKFADNELRRYRE
jgi:hypothetical protein